MDILDKLLKNNPCGRTLGHGESCVSGHECSGCFLRIEAAMEIKKLRIELEGNIDNEHY